MTIEATSKENDYSKQCINCFQSWHMGTINRLLQTALQKQTHSSRQPEMAIIMYCHTVGENGLGFKSTPPSLPNCSRSASITSISNDLYGMEDDVLWAEQYDKSDTDEKGDNVYDDMMTHEHIK